MRARWQCASWAWGLLLIAAWGCGDDESNRVAESCGAACRDIANGCAVPVPSSADCSAACELAGGLALDCGEQYAAVIDCATAHPLLACQDSTVSVTVSGDCIAPLSNYLVCAATSVTPICVDLPLQDPTCAAQGLPRASACVGQPPSCVLQAGAVVNAQGVGIFCCS